MIFLSTICKNKKCVNKNEKKGRNIGWFYLLIQNLVTLTIEVECVCMFEWTLKEGKIDENDRQ